MSDIFNLTDNWNAGGTVFTAIRMNVTDTASDPASLLMDLQKGGVSQFKVGKNGGVTANNYSSPTTGFGDIGGVGIGYLTTGRIVLRNTGALDFSSTGAYASPDCSFSRAAAGIVGLTNGSTGGAAFECNKMTAPSAPAANKVRLFLQDNGSGKMQLMALFPSGSAQQVAIEP